VCRFVTRRITPPPLNGNVGHEFRRPNATHLDARLPNRRFQNSGYEPFPVTALHAFRSSRPMSEPLLRSRQSK
jgi:hypothetical protein